MAPRTQTHLSLPPNPPTLPLATPLCDEPDSMKSKKKINFSFCISEKKRKKKCCSCSGVAKSLKGGWPNDVNEVTKQTDERGKWKEWGKGGKKEREVTVSRKVVHLLFAT